MKTRKRRHRSSLLHSLLWNSVHGRMGMVRGISYLLLQSGQKMSGYVTSIEGIPRIAEEEERYKTYNLS